MDAADPDDRLFFLQLGHLANEIVILRKIAMYGFNDEEAIGAAEEEARRGMALLAIRFVAGRLHEGDVIIHRQKNGRRLKTLIARAPEDSRNVMAFEEGLAAQKGISAYFGRPGNLVTLIRNKLAFHSNQDVMAAAYRALPGETVLVDFLSEHMGDSFYGSSEIVAQEVLLQLTGLDDLNAASDKIREEILELSGLFEVFMNAYRLAFISVYASEHLNELAHRKIEIDVPMLTDVRTPFFTQPFD